MIHVLRDYGVKFIGSMAEQVERDRTLRSDKTCNFVFSGTHQRHPAAKFPDVNRLMPIIADVKSEPADTDVNMQSQDPEASGHQQMTRWVSNLTRQKHQLSKMPMMMMMMMMMMNCRPYHDDAMVFDHP